MFNIHCGFVMLAVHKQEVSSVKCFCSAGQLITALHCSPPLSSIVLLLSPPRCFFLSKLVFPGKGRQEVNTMCCGPRQR